MIIFDEYTCPECLGIKDDTGNSLCDNCIDEINEEENCLEREHIANEIFQYRSQLI